MIPAAKAAAKDPFQCSSDQSISRRRFLRKEFAEILAACQNPLLGLEFAKNRPF